MNTYAIAMSSVLLRNMPKEFADSLYQSAVEISVSVGEVLFRDGEPAKHVYVVLDGVLKLGRIDSQGNEAVVAIQRAGDSIATALAFGKNDYPVSCSAVANSRVLLIKNDHIRAVVLRSEETMGAVLAATYAHLHELVNQVAHLKASSAQKRLVRFLLTLCDTQSGPASVELPYEKTIIAGVLGVTPETLSRSFGKLKDLDVKVIGTRVEIGSLETLMEFLETG